MTDKSVWQLSSFGWALIIDGLIFALALGFDLATDRSFGAVMLAVLPISLIALAYLVLGPWLEDAGRSAAGKAWLFSALIILVISTAFSLLGADQAKSGEEIFTYAVLMMALPSSLVLPFAATWLAPTFGDNVTSRIVSAWITCAAAGWLEWIVLKWLAERVRRRQGRRS